LNRLITTLNKCNSYCTWGTWFRYSGKGFSKSAAV